jgi:dTDP-glucose 4,6-dehydratase
VENESSKKFMKRNLKNVIVTGGAGFIGSHVVKTLNRVLPETNVYIVDCLTYAGSMENVAGTESHLFYMDIRDRDVLENLEEYDIDAIIHLAAESHVDRSIEDPLVFVETNVIGTVNLLDLGLKYKKKNPDFIFYHISTDEVFGTLGFGDKPFNEETPYDPHSPYSASKASSDHFVRAYADTYGLNTLISNCSNNYGPNQYPEKLIPVVIKSLIERKPIPIYGKGENIRDWLYVEDHAEAIVEILQKGRFGETYCIGGDCELSNLDLVKRIILKFDEIEKTYSTDLISFVTDRPGHDLRYAIDHSKLTKEIGWKPRYSLNYGLTSTVEWYIRYFKE